MAAMNRYIIAALLVLATASTLGGAAGDGGTVSGAPNILFITVDTLRTDRMSIYGYGRVTSPNLDVMMAAGALFTHARTIEPLTNPALASMLTSLYPHEHGSTRNGLRMRSGLASLPKTMKAHGYRTVAFVGNWTLKDKLSGLGEHFDEYEEVLTRARWFGLVRREASAHDVSERAVDWIEAHVRERSGEPFLAWVHYIEPHAPYRMWRDYIDQLGMPKLDRYPPADRYDTEIAFTDDSIGLLLKALENLDLTRQTMIVFAADHGESLGEHGYWGHGRHLYEPTLRIPMSITWPGHISPQEIKAPALIIDLAPTVLSLIGEQAHPAGFKGFDWSAVFSGSPPPTDRLTHYQAHRGAVISKHDSDLARKSGLLAVGIIRNSRKEIFRKENRRHWLFDLEADPSESSSLSAKKESPSEGLRLWMTALDSALDSFDDLEPEPLDEESIRQLKALGYVD
jgi:arylsulfatase A-like enzyme